MKEAETERSAKKCNRDKWQRIELNTSEFTKSWQSQNQDLKFMERKRLEVDHSENIRGSKVKTVIEQQEIIHKHQVKSATVDGSIQTLDYHYFMSVFKETVKYKIDDTHEKLVRL